MKTYKVLVGDPFGGYVNVKSGLSLEDAKTLELEVNSICIITGKGRSQDEIEANEKLICAAPELLKALQELLPLADDGYQSNCKNAGHEEFLQEDRSLLKNAREAIRKATS